MLALARASKSDPMLTYLRNTRAFAANIVERKLHLGRIVKKDLPEAFTNGILIKSCFEGDGLQAVR